MIKQEKIEKFLEQLGTSSEGKFFLVCGKCGVQDQLSEDGGDKIEQEIDGVYSEYTGHLWDTVNIKCKECGNAISFTK